MDCHSMVGFILAHGLQFDFTMKLIFQDFLKEDITDIFNNLEHRSMRSECAPSKGL